MKAGWRRRARRRSEGKVVPSKYVVAIPLAFVSPWIAVVLYVAIALMWFVPDRRIESVVNRPE